MPQGGTIGNAGGGRKSAYEEFNKANAINKLWEKVNKKVMAGEQLSEYEEKLVLSILPKTIKTDVGIGNFDGTNLQPVLVKFISNENDRDSAGIQKAV